MTTNDSEDTATAHGVCLRATAVARLGRHRFRMAMRRGDLVPLLPRVVVERRCLTNPKTLAASAVLSVGEAVLARETAAFFHGCESARPTPIHLLVPYGSSPKSRSGVVIHQGRIEPEDIVVDKGLTMSSLEYTLMDVLCTVRPRRALACLDDALRQLPGADANELKSRLAIRLTERPDRRGTHNASTLIDLGDGSRESPAESSVRWLLHDGGFAAPVSQFPVLDIDGKQLYRLDFAWPDCRIALEYDGYAAHEGRAVRDTAREEDLLRRGWLIVRADAADLADPTRLYANLTRAFVSRLGNSRDR